MKVIEARHINTKFEDKLIHKDLNFFVNENEIFGIWAEAVLENRCF